MKRNETHVYCLWVMLRFLFGVQTHLLVAWELKCSHISYDETSASSDQDWCDLTFHIEARRVYTSHLINLIAFPSFLTITSFCASAIPPDDVASRLSTALTLMLTLTAFKLMVNEMVPKAAYLTAADAHILASFAFVGAVLFENWYVAFFYDGAGGEADSDEQRRMDHLLLGAIFAAFVAWNLFFGLGVGWQLYRRGSKTTRIQSVRKGSESVLLGDIPKDSIVTNYSRPSQLMA